MDDITIEPVEFATQEVRELIDQLDRALAMEYLPEQQHGLTLSAIFQPQVRFFVARLAGQPLGCGGVAFLTSFAEVKRMFVRDEARGRGIGRALLSRIEQETLTRGFDLLRLETGQRQVAAMRLYERAGFQRCGAFGAYAAMTPQAIATSIFLEKRLNEQTCLPGPS